MDPDTKVDGFNGGKVIPEEEEEEEEVKNEVKNEIDATVPFVHHNFAHRETRRNDATFLQLDINHGHKPPDHIKGVVVSDFGAQVRLTMHLESKPIVCLPMGTKVKIYEVRSGKEQSNELRRRIIYICVSNVMNTSFFARRRLAGIPPTRRN